MGTWGAERSVPVSPGVDFLLACVDDALELVALSTNSQRCLETCLLAEGMGRAMGEPPGDLPRLLAEILLHRAQCHLVEGKDILLIGAGGVSKSFVWEAARGYGLRVRGLVGTAISRLQSERGNMEEQSAAGASLWLSPAPCGLATPPSGLGPPPRLSPAPRHLVWGQGPPAAPWAPPRGVSRRPSLPRDPSRPQHLRGRGGTRVFGHRGSPRGIWGGTQTPYFLGGGGRGAHLVAPHGSGALRPRGPADRVPPPPPPSAALRPRCLRPGTVAPRGQEAAGGQGGWGGVPT